MTQAAGHPTMSFGDAILAGFRQYAEFGGRAGVAEFWVIGTMVPMLAVGVRRLRDAGRRWTEFFWLLIPIAGLIAMAIRMSEPSKP